MCPVLRLGLLPDDADPELERQRLLLLEFAHQRFELLGRLVAVGPLDVRTSTETHLRVVDRLLDEAVVLRTASREQLAELRHIREDELCLAAVEPDDLGLLLRGPLVAFRQPSVGVVGLSPGLGECTVLLGQGEGERKGVVDDLLLRELVLMGQPSACPHLLDHGLLERLELSLDVRQGAAAAPGLSRSRRRDEEEREDNGCDEPHGDLPCDGVTVTKPAGILYEEHPSVNLCPDPHTNATMYQYVPPPILQQLPHCVGKLDQHAYTKSRDVLCRPCRA